MPLHRVWEYRDIGRLFITVGVGERVIIGVLRWGWVEVILRVSLEVILHHLLRHLSTVVTPQLGAAGVFPPTGVTPHLRTLNTLYKHVFLG